MDERERITSARIVLLASQPFFGHLAMRLKVEESTSCPTTSTDGDYIYFNPEFTKKLSNQELTFVVAHEVMHAAFRHPFRMSKAFDKLRYNIAADILINELIAANNIGKQPDNLATQDNVEWAIKPTMPILKYSADQLYTMLARNDDMTQCQACAEIGHGQQSGPSGSGDKDDNKNKGSGSGHTGQHCTDSGKPVVCGGLESSEDLQKAEDWRQSVQSAMEVSKSRGITPAGMEMLLDKLYSSRKNWKELLWEFVLPEPGDYSINPPNRRYIGWGQNGLMEDLYSNPVVIPDIYPVEKLKDVVFILDTSGSMSDQDVTEGVSESVEIGKIASNFWLGYCDAAMNGFYEIDDSGSLPPKPKGRGGTDFKPAFKFVQDKIDSGELEVKCLIYFTDGEAPYNNFPKPDYPVLWVVNSDIVPPWGMHVEYP